jgi:hypothetical protein
MRIKYTPIVLFFLLLFFLGASVLKGRWYNKGTQAPICWDGFGYYFYLPTFFYDDFKEFKQYDYIQKNYSPTGGGTLGVKEAPNGNLIMRYPIGAAFLYFPGFIVGHILAKVQGYPVDGFSVPYQLAMCIWTTLFGMIGLWVLSRLLLRYYEDRFVALSILTLGVASNVFCYITFTQLHTHIYLFTVYATILWLTDTLYLREKFNYALVAAIGLLCGLATACRPTEIISCLIPVLWGIGNWDAFKRRIAVFIHQWKATALFVLMAFVGVSPLLIYWKLYSGHWFFYSYEDDQTFSFLHPNIINFLFSYKKGWFTYTPVMYIAMFGFYWLWHNKRIVFVPVLTFFVVNLYLISSWDCWWYGGSFSQRAIIQAYPILMFPFVELVQVVSRKKIARFFLFGFILFCTWLNLLMTYQAVGEGNVMESDCMTKAYFWRIFGKTSIDKYDRKLLDTDEELPAQLESTLKLFYQTNYEDSIGNSGEVVLNGTRSVELNSDIQFAGTQTIPLPKSEVGWIRAKVMVYFPQMESNYWKWTQFTLTLKNQSGEEKQKAIRAQRSLEPGKWSEVFVDIKNEESKAFDSLKIYYWNADGTGNVYFDSLGVYSTPSL